MITKSKYMGKETYMGEETYMLNILNEKMLRSEESIEKEYQDCMYIMINYTNLENPQGYLYCVSTSRDSYHDICLKANDLEKKDIPCILAGNYAEAAGSGLIYEMEGKDVSVKK